MKQMKRLTVNGHSYQITDEMAVRFDGQELSPEEKKQARENIGAADVELIGDVEAALDAILAIQAALMGGEQV